MRKFRPVLLVIGVLLSILSVTMLIPAITDIINQNDDWSNFLLSSFLTAFVGVSLFLINQGDRDNLSIRQAFLLTTMSWLSLVTFAALPFMFSELNMNYTDAFFEAMSALTTTGATVLVGLDDMPPGILIWRAILQWLGGIGIIVMALAILPMLKIGGMQLFRTESSDKSDKILPKATQISSAIGTIYLSFTIICGFALFWAGMSPFDAICHAMTTIATGGFSTHDKSIGYFNSVNIEMIIAIFMLMSSIPYVLYIQLVRGNMMAIWRDTQVQWYIVLGFLALTVVFMWLYFHENMPPLIALRYATFNITSIITTSGFVSADYSTWGSFVVTLIFLLTVMGGCTGSTTGGIKIFRYQILYETAKVQIRHLIQPHGVFRPVFNGKTVSEIVTSAVMSFFILFAFCFLVVATLLSFTGLDYITSMSAAASTLANVGPGLGEVIGPSGNYASLPDSAKWLLAGAMLIGRLEIFTVLVLCVPYFWRD